MRKKSLFFILIIIIFIFIAISFIVFASKSSITNKSNLKNINAKDTIKNDNEDIINATGNITSQHENEYNIDVTFHSDKCISQIQMCDVDGNEVTDNNIVFQDESKLDQQALTSSETLEKDKTYKYKIKLANGDEYYKDFKIKNAKISIGDVQKNNDGTYSFPNFTIDNPMHEKLSNIVIQFASEINSADKLIMTQLDNTTLTNNNTLISIDTSQIDTDTLQQGIRDNLKVSLASAGERSVSIQFGVADKKIDKTLSYYAGTNHYYENVSAPGITWTDAKDAAEKRYYMGQQGYLATITSEGEQKFAVSLISGSGWIGGTCCYQYIYDKNGNRVFNDQNSSFWHWYWVTGPEAGEPFTYTNWGSGQPDASGGTEMFAHLWSNIGYQWNDLSNYYPSIIVGYIVEYGGMPNDKSTIKQEYIANTSIDLK